MYTPPLSTIGIEDTHSPPFFLKTPICIERGDGVFVWDESGRRYLDLTAGWAVTSLGHANPAIVEAIAAQAARIMQNPNAGTTYSPVRSRLLALMAEILPAGLTRVFFTSGGAEGIDAAMKLARKVTGRRTIIAALSSFHGRTLAALSATGQVNYREALNPLVPDHSFVPYDDLGAMERAFTANAAAGVPVAAVLLEPIQSEGGVHVPATDYLPGVSSLCREHGALLILDEVQTGFCRTGPMFACEAAGVRPDFVVMAKGMGGGFPVGAFAMTDAVATRLGRSDHGGTYCGNPLGCAVAYAVIRYLLDNRIGPHVASMGEFALSALRRWQAEWPEIIRDIRGRGLLLGIELHHEADAATLLSDCLDDGLILNCTQKRVVRVFPALTIKREELEEGMAIMERTIARLAASARECVSHS